MNGCHVALDLSLTTKKDTFLKSLFQTLGNCSFYDIVHENMKLAFLGLICSTIYKLMEIRLTH